MRGTKARLEKVDITQDPDLVEAYGHMIPVVTVDGEPLFYGKVSAFRLAKVLAGEGLSARYQAFLRSLPERLQTFVP